MTDVHLVAVVLAALLPALWLLRRRKRALIPAGAAWLAAAVWLGISGLSPEAPRVVATTENRPLEAVHDGYVSSRTCAACHPGPHATWSASYHRSMTRLATPETVEGPFDDVDLTVGDVGGFDARFRKTYHLSRRGDEIWVEVGEKGSREERPLVMVTGSHHFQMFWWPTGVERAVELFPFAYFLRDRKWIPADALVLVDPRKTTLYSIWNANCIGCHATGAQPRIRGPEAVDTRVGEFGIACEACHGPAERHVEMNRDPRRRYELHLGEAADPTIVNPADLSHERSSEVCGQCHSVNTLPTRAAKRGWLQRGYSYRPGDELAKTRLVYHDDAGKGAEGETAFWSDEMVRVNGREYNSLLKTPCFQRGELSCLSCHAMHKAEDDPRPLDAWTDDQLAPGMRENGACVSCHPRFDDEEALAAHTHHAPESAGSRCYDCHMPHTAYGLQKATRSHQVTSPTVAESLEVGRPNACNLCHLDRPLAWTARHLERWYGQPRPPLADVHTRVAASAVWALSGDAGQRVLAAWHMGWEPAREASGGAWMAPYLAQLLADPYPAVRSVAYQALREHEGFREFEYDFAGAPATREEARRRALRIWRATAHLSEENTGRQVLVDRSGSIHQPIFDELLRRRNDRFLWLSE